MLGIPIYTVVRRNLETCQVKISQIGKIIYGMIPLHEIPRTGEAKRKKADWCFAGGEGGNESYYLMDKGF